MFEVEFGRYDCRPEDEREIVGYEYSIVQKNRFTFEEGGLNVWWPDRFTVPLLPSLTLDGTDEAGTFGAATDGYMIASAAGRDRRHVEVCW